MKGWNAVRNVYNKDQIHEVLVGNKDSTRNWSRRYTCYNLSENLSTFYQHPETLCEIEIKHSTLMNLVEKISRDPNVQTAAWALMAAISYI